MVGGYMRVGIATDHGGFGLKEELLGQLRAAGHEVVDFGAHRLSEGDDYPDYVVPLAAAVAAQKVERGVAICGSGVGASVCANKVRGVRADRRADAAAADGHPALNLLRGYGCRKRDNVVGIVIALAQAMSAEIDDLVSRSAKLAEQFFLQTKSTVISGNADAHISSYHRRSCCFTYWTPQRCSQWTYPAGH